MFSKICGGFIFLVCSVIIIASSTIAYAVEYGGIGGVPANPAPDNARTKSIFIYTIAPGQVKQDGVNVVNSTDQTKTIEVYAADSEIASGGAFACRQKVDSRQLVGNWIKLSKTQVKLAPNSSEIIQFAVEVPKSASVGEQNGCIVIQEKQSEAEQSGNGVQLSFRSAIRVAVTIPGKIVKDLQFTSLTRKTESKKYILKALLNNKGNVSLDTNVQVYVTNIFKKRKYQNGGTYPILTQVSAVELNFDFSRPYWGGFYMLTGTADYNGQPNAPLGSIAPNNIRKHAPETMFFVPPQPLALLLEIIGVMTLLGLSFVAYRYFLGHKKMIKTWQPYKVRSGDTLVKLAQRRSARWKTIARVNQLRAPYELQKGITIKLPPNPKAK